MATLTFIARKKAGDKYWRYGMDYNQACRKYKQEHEDLKFLKKRLKKATTPEDERVQKNIASKRKSIENLEKWFQFTGNLPPEIS